MTPEDLRKAADILDTTDFGMGYAAGLRAMADAEPVHVATVAEVHMSRYTLEWANGPLPEGTKLYATPQRPQWVGLTEDERQAISLQVIREDSGVAWRDAMATAIESALRAKNGGAA